MDREVAKGTLTGFENQNTQLWLAQRRLYEKLTEEGNPYSGDTVITDFIASAQTNGLKNYADIQIGLRQAFIADTSDLALLDQYETQISQSLDSLAEKEILLNAYNLDSADSLTLTQQRNTIRSILDSLSTLRDNKLNSLRAARVRS